MRSRAISAAACIVAVWFWAPTGRAEQAYSGSADYQVFCSSCHGTEARGDGVIARSLPKRPADLTRLTERNKGVFPDEKVARTIDGREPLSAHGNSDMPAWGEVFAKSQESQGAEKTKARIAGLVDYLKTLQEKR
jgi:mono/diheme cytochrome c family protein